MRKNCNLNQSVQIFLVTSAEQKKREKSKISNPEMFFSIAGYNTYLEATQTEPQTEIK